MLDKQIRLNIGCGSTKIKGCINIDVEKSCKPDLVCDFVREPLPYEDNSVHEIYMFHVIEHIQKKMHKVVLGQFFRVLHPAGRVIISYPEWIKCAQHWITNYLGKREFWEATLYGRQLYPSDHHVCIMDSIEFKQTLAEAGFSNIRFRSEKDEKYNTIVSCTKGERFINYEELVAMDKVILVK